MRVRGLVLNSVGGGEPWEMLEDAIGSKLGSGTINLATGKRMIGGREGRQGDQAIAPALAQRGLVVSWPGLGWAAEEARVPGLFLKMFLRGGGACTHVHAHIHPHKLFITCGTCCYREMQTGELGFRFRPQTWCSQVPQLTTVASPSLSIEWG